jgi:tyrosinase
MGHNRRDFLRTVMAGASWGLLGACATVEDCRREIANRPVRRNINSLAPDHPIIVAYKSAITQMKALPASDPRSWTNQARIHNDFCPHANWLFLPWHRIYLLYFERICRKLSGMADFALPYWDWTANPRVPAVFWGASSNPLFDATRMARETSVASPANVGPDMLESILGETNFLVFGSTPIAATASQRTTAGYGRLEGTPHNYIHGFVGGNMGAFMSPLDPIFWLHHNNIERRWVEWNFVRERANTNDRAWLDREFTEFCDENGQPVRVKVDTSLLFPALSYRFDDVGPGPAPGPGPAGAPRAMVADTKASQEQHARTARAGARVRLEVVRRLTPALPLTAELGKPSSLRFGVEPQSLRGMRREDGNRTLIAFNGASLDHTTDFSVRVFVNKPDATAETPPSDPHFAGAFAFFHHGGAGHAHGQGGTGDFIVDASDALKRLNLEGGPITLTVVLAPYPDRQPRTRVLQVAATELRIVKDVVEGI